MQRAYLTACQALRCRQAYSAHGIRRRTKFVRAVPANRRGASWLNWRIAVRTVAGNSVLSPTTIGVSASAAKPAKPTSLRKRRKTMRAWEGGLASYRAALW